MLTTETSVIIGWRSNNSTDSVVNYGTVQGLLTSSASDASVVTDHFVTVSDLSPGTKYFYDVGETGDVHVPGDANHYFITAPTTGSSAPFTVWAVGDGGNGTSTQVAVMNAMVAANGGNSPDLALYLGDIAYGSGTDPEFTDNYFTPYDPVIRNTPVWPTLGNHEGASTTSGECAPLPCTAGSTGPYYDAFVLPAGGEAGGAASGTEAYYSFNYGSTHFIALNSYEVSRSASGPMALWLTADLSMNLSQWTVVFFHHPPYSKGTHDSDTEIELIQMRENLLPILEAAGVDLVLAGHSHIYERSFLIDGVYTTPTPDYATLLAAGKIIDAGDGRVTGAGAYSKTAGPQPHEGTVYVVAGHGGQGTGGAGNHPVMFFSEAANGSVLIDISSSELTLRNVRVDGTVTDSFTITKSVGCTIDADCVDLTDDCNVGDCNGGGFCVAVPNADSTPCDDEIACTDNSAGCQSGVCSAVDVCVAPESCNLLTGVCEVPPAPPLPIIQSDNWTYFKGTAEPTTPIGDLAWAQVGFDDSSWLSGPSGFGYGDISAPNTVLSDMSGGYNSVYFRREFSIVDPALVESLILSVDYDDAVVVYINGVEVVRTAGLLADGGGTPQGVPPTFDQLANFPTNTSPADDQNHESSGGSNGNPPEVFDIGLGTTTPTPPAGVTSGTFVVYSGTLVNLLQAGNNVIAIHGHNVMSTSSDFVIVPTLTATFFDCAVDADCDSADGCAAGVCTAGSCSTTPTNEGGACDDGSDCTVTDVCASGICAGTPIDCGGLLCDPLDGECVGCVNDLDCAANEVCSGLRTCVPGPVTVTFQQGVGGYGGTVDTELNAALPDQDNSMATTLVVDTAPSVRQILLRFENLFVSEGGDIPDGATITSATVTVNISNASLQGASLHRMLQIWSDTDTWNIWTGGIQADDVEAAATPDLVDPGSGVGLHVMDVTSSIAAWSAGAANHGWAWLQSVDDSWQFDSSEAGTPPLLSVTYELASCVVDGDCDDGNDCTDDTCPAGTCVYTPNDANVCDDGEACTDDACVSGTCLGTPNDSNTCTDGIDCTDDVCSGGSCVSVDACTGGEVCDPLLGCVDCVVDVDCDDNDACTGTETCSANTCVAGTPLVCDDSIACTDDSCDADIGCVNTDNCTGGDVCNTGTGICDSIVTFQQNVSGYTGTVDTFLELFNPTVNNGNLDTWGWDGSDPNGQPIYGLIRFDSIFGPGLDQIPVGAQIISATLEYAVWNEGEVGNVHEMLVTWTENDGLTAVCGADCDAGSDYDVPVVDSAIATPVGTYSVDVTSSVAYWSPSPSDNRGWILVPTGAGGVDVRSSEYATQNERPKLTVEFLPCAINADCDDGNFCTADVCNAGTCEYTNTNEGSGCDDGVTCTASDVCGGGVCAGVDNCAVDEVCNLSTGVCDPLPNTPPDAPANPSPADAATGVPANPTLCVDVSDPDGDAMDVTFYGRESTTVPTPDFTIIALPDTQFYSETNPWVYLCQTEWVIDEGFSSSGSCPSTPVDIDFGYPHGLNIVYTAGLGDCVQNGDNNQPPEWDNADSAMSVFDPLGDEEKMPFDINVGNHDQTPIGSAGSIIDPASTTFYYNQFFGVDRFQGRSYYGGSFNHCDDGTECNIDADCTGIGAQTCHINNDNHYALFSAGGMDFILISMEWDDTASPLRAAVLVWADDLLTTYSNRRAIVVSHFVVQPNGSFSAQGQAIYNALSRHTNWFLMLGGHLNEAARRQDPVGPTLTEGTLTSIMSDYQNNNAGQNGGNGWLRVMTFSPENDTITVTTYSPYLDQKKPNSPAPSEFNAHNFVIGYDMAGVLPFQVIGMDSAVTSGGQACVTWPGRQAGTDYEWYVEIDDGQDVTSSAASPFMFTSDASCSADLDCDDGVFCNGMETCDIGGTDTCLSGSDPCPGQLCDEVGGACVPCGVDGDCDDSDPCTNDVCGAGTCSSTPIDCSDGNACTDDVCIAGVCSNPYDPTTGCCTGGNGDCDDGDACTIDTCDGTISCVNMSDPLCCSSDGFCGVRVHDVCTIGTCDNNPAALSFDGLDDRVSLGDGSTHPELRLTTFTVEAWFRRTGPGIGATVASGRTAVPIVTKGRGLGDGGGVDINYTLAIEGDFLIATYEDATGTDNIVLGTTTLLDNVWYHGAVTYDGEDLRLFLNGVEEDFLTTMLVPATNDIAFGIGTTYDDGLPPVADGAFAGDIDEVRVWKRALGISEIQANLNLEITFDPDLVGRWGFNEGTGATAADSSASANNGTVDGATWQLVDPPDIGKGTCQFDPLPGCCVLDTDCSDDGNACTIENCVANVCENSYMPSPGCCFADTDCDDSDPLTLDTCDGASGDCSNVASTPCAADTDCDDTESCTVDVCVTPNAASLSFDGSNDYVDMGLAPGLGSSAFTLEAWIQWNGGGDPASSGTGGVTSGIPIVAKGRGEADGSNLDCNYFFAIDSASGTLAADFESVDPAPNNFPVFGTTAVTTGTWHHVAATYDGMCWELYLDGVADTAGTTCPARTPRFDSIQHFAIGGALDSVGARDGAFAGLIDEVRVWDRALSTAEIQANMNLEIESAPNLIGRWGLNEGAGAVAGDSTTPAEDGTIMEATWESVDLPILSGVCSNTPIGDGGSCEDGNECTVGETCTGGVCGGGTIDCDDGDPCNGDETCNVDVCVPGTPVVCGGGEVCDPQYGTCSTPVCVTFQQGVGNPPYGGTVDTYVFGTGGNDNTNYSGDPEVRQDLDNTRHGLLYFGNLFVSSGGPIPDGATIDSAELTYWVTDSNASGPNGCALHRMIQPWVPSVGTLTWNTLVGGVQADGIEAEVVPDVTGAPLAPPADTGPRFWSVTVTPSLAAWSAGTANEGWVFLPLDNNGYFFSSSEEPTVADRPLLEVCYLPEPCFDNGDCDDGDPCTDDVCEFDSTCSNMPIVGCCAQDSDCDDVDPCTVDTCVANACSNVVDPLCCTVDADCDDGSVCTVDWCSLPTLAAGSFDGTDDYVTMGAAPNLNAQTFTVEAWIKWDGGGSTANTGNGGFVAIPMVTKGVGESEADGLNLNYFLGIVPSSGNVLGGDFEQDAGGGSATGQNFPVYGTTPVTTGVWHHVAMTYDGSCWELYLDGTADTAGTTCPNEDPDFDSVQHFAIGAALNSGGTPSGAFDGLIDEVRVWDYARSDVQIAAAMNATLSSAGGLLGRWSLDEGGGTIAADSTGNGNFGTLTNGATWELIDLPTLNANECITVGTPGCCEDDTDCDDGDICTTDACDDLGTNACHYTPIPGCCTQDSDCDDLDPCTVDTCVANACSNVVDPLCCSVDGDCDDGDVCTADTCDPSNAAAISFDGSNDYIDLGNDPAISDFGAGSFTVEGWFYATSAPGLYDGIFRHGRQGAFSQVAVQFNASGQLTVSVESTAAGQVDTPGQAISLNTWHHFAAVVDRTANQILLYLDGGTPSTVASSWGANPISSTDNVLLGAARDSAGNLISTAYFDGLIDEIRIWDHARTQGEIVANMNAQISSATGLLARYGLNEAIGTTTTDSVGALVGTLTGGPLWETVNVPTLGDSQCDFTPISGCCIDVGDCSDDGNACTIETCVANVCGSSYMPSPGCCFVDADCDDGDPLTLDTCDGAPGDCSNVASTPCAADAECDDTNSCTTDVCVTTATAALLFDGSGDYVDFGTSASHPELGLTQFTIEAWFRRDGGGTVGNIGDGASDAEAIVAKGRGAGEGGNQDFNYFLGVRQNSVTLVGDFETDNSGAGHRVDGTTVLQTGVWYHGALTYDQTVLTLYLNGDVEDTFVTSDAPEAQSVLPFSIGAAFDLSMAGALFNGGIDEVRVWDYARSQSEIQSTMNQQITSATGLVGRWGFEEGSGPATADTSGNGNDGTLIANTAWITSGLPILSGVCSNTPIGDGGSCDDGNQCTVGETCFGGVCGNGTIDCDDGDPCTTDVCNVDICENTPIIGCCSDNLDCDDGDPCTTEICNIDICEYTPIPGCCSDSADCNDGDVCTQDSCLLANSSGLSFNGSTDYVTMGAALGLNTATFTLETWFKWNGGGVTASTGTGGINAYPLVTKGRGEADNDPADMNYFLGILPGGTLAADFEEHSTGGSPGLNHPVQGSTMVTTGVWHHAAVTYDGNCWQLYLDGVPDTPGTNCPMEPPNFISTQHFGLGTALRSTGATEGLFDGLLDEVRVWDRALGAAEIQANLYLEIESAPNLIGRWGLNEGAGAVAGDSTSPTEDGNIVGATWETVDLPDIGAGTCQNDANAQINVNLEVEALGSVMREVTFVITTCGGAIDTRVVPDVDFVNGMATVLLTGVDESAEWIQAIEGHTLGRRLPLAFTACDATAGFTGGNRLLAGDFQTSFVAKDNIVEIVDFSILASRWNTLVSDCGGIPGDPTCALGADATGNGVQDTSDFTAVRANFATVGDPKDGCSMNLLGGGPNGLDPSINGVLGVQASDASYCTHAGSMVTFLLTVSDVEEAIDGVQALITYDDTMLLLTGIAPGDGVGSPWDSAVEVHESTTDGTLTYALVLPGSVTTADAVVARLTFVALSTGSASLGILPSVPPLATRLTANGLFGTPGLEGPAVVSVGQYGDSDGDGDVDLLDFADLAACMTGTIGAGSGPAYPLISHEHCPCFDTDFDGDIDLADFSVFQTASDE